MVRSCSGNIRPTVPYLHNGRVSSFADACRLLGTTQLDTELKDEEIELNEDEVEQICKDWKEYPTLQEAMEDLNLDSIQELKRNHFVLGEGPFVIGA